MVVVGQHHSPAALTPGKKPKGAKWTPGPVWTGAKNLVLLLGFDPRTVQPVASRCTDLAIPANGKYPVRPDMGPLLWKPL
jgi:hypothetical protein